MRSLDEDGVSWDFAPVFDLISSLSFAPGPYANQDQSATPSPERIVTPTCSPDRRATKSDLGNFDKVWNFLGQPVDVEPPEVPSLPADLACEDLDENTRLRLTISKGVHWRDETEGGELADNEEAENDPILAGLNKNQRKKFRRRQRKAAIEKDPNIGITATSSSENDSEPEPRTRKRSPDRKAIIQQILQQSPSTPHEKPVVLAEVKTRPPLPIDAGAWPIAKPHWASPLPKSSPATSGTALAVAARKKEKLLKRLEEHFIEDRDFLTGINMIPSMLTDNTGTKEGIHVFVDASNIMIGFHDTLKLSRGLGLQSRLRRQPLSFHNLSLILERGRPVSKRVLVGSDSYPSIQEARLIGYETNILDRVHKAKELTPRQKRYHSSSAGNGTTSGGSGSESTAVYAKEKWVEQAVDEILHLKILESIVDAESPSTMVLATGDAAEAEYSQGFLRMAERALEKGWKMELVSFSKNMSGMYKRKGFREKWGRRFKIVELDDFVEELLGFEP